MLLVPQQLVSDCKAIVVLFLYRFLKFLIWNLAGPWKIHLPD